MSFWGIFFKLYLVGLVITWIRFCLIIEDSIMFNLGMSLFWIKYYSWKGVIALIVVSAILSAILQAKNSNNAED